MLANENVRNCWSLLLSTRVLRRKDYQKPSFSQCFCTWCNDNCKEIAEKCKVCAEDLFPSNELRSCWFEEQRPLWSGSSGGSDRLCSAGRCRGWEKHLWSNFMGGGDALLPPASAALSTITTAICCFWENFRSGNWKIWAQSVDRLLDGQLVLNHEMAEGNWPREAP